MGKIADISKYQGTIDWTKAAQELDFCVLRASIGLKDDTRYDANAEGCKANNVPFGAYHYLKALTPYDADREAEVFHKQATPTAPLFYAIDCEYAQITKAEKAEYGAARAIVEAFEARLRELAGADIKVGVYIGHHLYKTWALDYARYGFVWIPRYGKNSGKPETQPAYACDLWQYTSNGALAGVKGRVDLNVLSGDKAISYFTDGGQKEEGTTMGFTGSQLAAFALQVYEAKWVYWYGTCGYKCTKSLYNSKKNQYPSSYTASRESGYLKDISNGCTCADCVGLVKAFFWKGGNLTASNKYGANNCPDTTATGMYNKCKETGPIASIPDIPGLVVWKSGHIGVYVGGGYTVELMGFAYDCKKRKVTEGTWTRWGKLPETMLTYDGSAVVAPEPIKLGDRTLSKGDGGDDVKAMQGALIALGYSCGKWGADGEFGAATLSALKAFQIDNGLDPDGTFGQPDLAALNATLPDEPEPGAQPAPAKPTAMVRIVGGDCHVRAFPMAAGASLGVAKRDTTHVYTGISTVSNWHLIEHAGEMGWVSGRYSRVV